jgi:class I fructose-bisphosphate aldolase
VVVVVVVRMVVALVPAALRRPTGALDGLSAAGLAGMAAAAVHQGAAAVAEQGDELGGPGRSGLEVGEEIPGAPAQMADGIGHVGILTQPGGDRGTTIKPARHPKEIEMATATATSPSRLEEILGEGARDLLAHRCETITKDRLHLPGPDFIERVVSASDRNVRVLRSLQTLFDHGRLGGTGYLSILPVDQGVEHSAGASFAPNPEYFDGERIVQLAIEGGCNAVASTFGVLGSVARRYAHRIPFICKLNHNELLTYPNRFDQVMFGNVQQAFELGAVAVGATIYWGSEESTRQLQEVAEAFHEAHELGMATVLWCYLRNPAFVQNGTDYHLAADLTGQANHLGVTIQADIIKQKLPETNGGYNALKFGKTSKLVYEKLTTDHPIDLTRYQVVNCYMGRSGLINSGGASSGEGDLREAVRTAVINKRAGGMGLITGRKAFQRPFSEGVGLLNAVQDVYLLDSVSVA